VVFVASTADTLHPTLGASAYAAVTVLAESPNSLSGRQVATALGVAPTAALSTLGKLRDTGFALSSREGRADHWHLNADHAVLARPPRPT
jgi:DNA-binding IscR family transcriptional regulator